MTKRIQRKLRSVVYPVGKDRLGWHRHYAEVHNTTGTADSATLAMWYLLLHLAEQDGMYD